MQKNNLLLPIARYTLIRMLNTDLAPSKTKFDVWKIDDVLNKKFKKKKH